MELHAVYSLSYCTASSAILILNFGTLRHSTSHMHKPNGITISTEVYRGDSYWASKISTFNVGFYLRDSAFNLAGLTPLP